MGQESMIGWNCPQPFLPIHQPVGSVETVRLVEPSYWKKDDLESSFDWHEIFPRP